jgi:hypothetical protein
MEWPINFEWTFSCRVDFNRFGGAGTATLDSFCRSMMLNCNLKALLLDGNRLGPEWGVRLAEAIARNGSLIQLSLRDNRLVIFPDQIFFSILFLCTIRLHRCVFCIGSAGWRGAATSIQKGRVSGRTGSLCGRGRRNVMGRIPPRIRIQEVEHPSRLFDTGDETNSQAAAPYGVLRVLKIGVDVFQQLFLYRT